MKRFLLFFAVCCIYTAQAQTNSEKITISFTNATLQQVIDQIETKTNYRFYYVEEWLKPVTISGNYTDAAITAVLKDVFAETSLNFYISPENRVILTRNNVIYDSLPETFFNKKQPDIVVDEEDALKTNPLFVDEDKSTQNTNIETIRIGKENRLNKRKVFTLSGYARDIITGEPIPSLAVLVKGRNTGVATDFNGYYEIELRAGLNVIETKSIANVDVTKNVIIYNDGTLNFELEQDLQSLDEVVLRTNKKANLKEAATGVTQINVEEIKTIPLVLGERDVLKVATILPGISTAGEGASGYNVRGGATDQNLILLDEATLYNPAHFFGIFSAINPFTTGNVEIFKGSVPAQYGGRLSSVFDIQTKDPNKEKFSGEGSIGPVTSSLTAEIPLVEGKSAIMVGGRATYSGLILNQLDDEQLRNSDANFYDAIVKFDTSLGEKDNLKATGYYSRDAFSITSDSLFSYSNRLASVQWGHTFNDKNRSTVILANSQYRFNIDFDADSNRDFELGYKVTETELKAKFKYIMSDAHKFDYGISGKLYNVQPGDIDPINGSDVQSLSIPEERAFEGALFIADTWEVNEKLLFDLGIRYSYFVALGPSVQNIYADGQPRNDGTLIEQREFSDNESIETYGGPEFRASFRYFLTPDFSIKGGYNTSYQYIHTLSNNTTVSPTDTFKLSDVNIEPQQGTQYSLGLFKNFADDTYEMSLEGYYKQTDNILDYKVGAQLLLNEQIETEILQGEGQAYGLEFLIKKATGRLNGWIGYTYSRSQIKLDSEFPEERVNNGEFFPSNFDKPHDFSVVANYKLTRRFSVSANFIYQTGRPVTFPIGSYELDGSEYVFYSDRNQFRIPDYYRMDISINIEGNHKKNKLAHSFWNISVYNVLGRNNPYSVFFVTDEGEVKAFQSSIFAIPVPTISYNFKF